MRPIRRDTCDWVRKTILSVLQSILKDRNVEDALMTIRRSVRDLVAGTVPWRDLAITKSLAKGTARVQRKRTHLDEFVEDVVMRHRCHSLTFAGYQ